MSCQTLQCIQTALSVSFILLCLFAFIDLFATVLLRVQLLMLFLFRGLTRPITRDLSVDLPPLI